MSTQSGSATQFNDGQVLLPVDVADLKIKAVATSAASSNPARPLRSRFETLPVCETSCVHLVRRVTGMRRVRAHCVVPDRVETELAPHRRMRHRHEHTSSALLLHRPNEPLNDRDARRLAEGTVTGADAALLAPAPVTLTAEHAVLVAHDVLEFRALTPDGPTQELPDLSGCRLAGKDREADQPSRHLIDGHGNPPAERPTLRNGKRKPRHPESGSRRDRREIDVPRMPRVASDHATSAGRRQLGLGIWFAAFADHPADRRCAEGQAGTGEDLGHAFVTDHGEQSFELSHQVSDEVGVAIGRLDRLDKTGLTLFVDTAHPMEQSLQVDQEDMGSLFQVSSASRSELKDAHSLGGRIVRPAPGLRPLPAAILDAKLFAKEGAFGFGLLEPGAEPLPAGCSAASVNQGNAGQGDGVEDARLDVPRPLPGQTNRCTIGHVGSESTKEWADRNIR